MSISFACDQCGKSFTLDDEFVGKKGKCKQCGAVMQIPSAPAARPVAREVASSRRPSAPPPPPREDVYGFDDDPLPSRSSPAGVEGEGVGSSVATRPKAKKKSGSLFGSSPKAQSSGGHSAFPIVLRIVIGILFGGGGIVATALGLPNLRTMFTPGYTSRSEFDALAKRQLDLSRELAGILGTVTDVPSAAAASPGANAAIRKIAQHMKANKDRKGSKKDIDELIQKYRSEKAQLTQALAGEWFRIGMIPGAHEAMAVDGTIEEALALEREIAGPNAQASLIPPPIPRPNFTPPPIPPPMPNFDPPAPPNRPGMPPGPGFNSPPNMPGMPPGPNFPGRRGRNRPGPG